MRRTTLGAALTLLLALGLAPNHAAAGAWAPNAGHGYLKLWSRYFFGYDYLDGSGRGQSLHRYHELSLATYGELGLGRSLALVWQTDLVHLYTLVDARDGARHAHVAPGDPLLGLRYAFYRGDRLSMAAQLGVRAPLASDSPQQVVYGSADGNPRLGELSVGAGVWDVGGELSAGYGFDHGYLQATAGYLVRTGGFDHVVEFAVEGGGDPNPRLGLRARLVGHLPVDTGDAPNHTSPSGVGNGTRYLGWALEWERRVGDAGWSLGGTLEGGAGLVRRQAGGPVFTLYVARRL